MKFYPPIVCCLVFGFVGAQETPAVAMERETIQIVYTGAALEAP
jgi:hypothetical protein